MANFDALFGTKQYIDGPDSLISLCCKLICDNLDIISIKDKDGRRILRNGVSMPNEIWDKIIEYAQYSDIFERDEDFFSIFSNLEDTKLKRVKILNCYLTDESVLTLVRHKLTELELINCCNITDISFENINAHSENLQKLVLCGGFMNIPPYLVFGEESMDSYYRRGYLLKAPNLRHLTLTQVRVRMADYAVLLANLPNLTHLDLSSNFDINHLFFVSLIPNLVSLTLYNVKINQHPELFIYNVCQLKQLRHLDISQSNSNNGTFENPNKVLADLVNGLPKLMSLDIGTTNLAGRGVAELPSDSKHYRHLSDIPGLASRVHNPLQFLGLYGTMHAACRRHDIPAKIIAGDANEEQILIAARVCMDNKQELLQKVLNDLYHLFRNERFTRMDQALCTVLEAMEKNPSEKQIQISGSATLFYLVKSKDKSELLPGMRRRIIGTLLTGMSAHKDEETMMRNGCLALCQFRIPQDVMWKYEALVKVLLHSAKHAEPEGFVQRIGIYLLNSLACQVEGKEKLLLGQLGCVSTMLQLVQYRVNTNTFDDVLEVAWSTMWNMTDETPINCERFLDKQGMDLFLKCMKQYPNREELLRNMMGLLGNVAEVEDLRIYLMQQQYVTVFASLLRSVSDGIEVSYNAAGILAHMASDGSDVWTIEKPSRSEVLELMVEAIEQWNLSAERNINYRSFLPLFRLLDVYHTPQCQHWAVWALANLTKVYPGKYCSLVVLEGGIEKLKTLLYDPRPYDCIKQLARQVISNCQDTEDVSSPTSSMDVDYNVKNTEEG